MSSISTTRSHRSIVLQALPISIYSFISSFDRFFLFLKYNDVSLFVLGFILFISCFLMSGYVVPFSFIIGNSRKRKIPHTLVFIDAVLCLHRVFTFYEIGEGFRKKLKCFLVLAIFSSVPFAIVLIVYMGLYISFRIFPTSTVNEMIDSILQSYIISLTVKMTLVVFTICGYLLILCSIKKQMANSTVATPRSHKTIVLQALPISIYSLIASFDRFFFFLNFENMHLLIFGSILFLASIFASGYVVPISFIIGNSQKRKMFLYIIRLDIKKQMADSTVATSRSHKTIVLQALPISIYSFFASFDRFFFFLNIDGLHLLLLGSNLFLASIFAAGYVVPMSFIIGNSQKREIFLYIIRILAFATFLSIPVAMMLIIYMGLYIADKIVPSMAFNTTSEDMIQPYYVAYTFKMTLVVFTICGYLFILWNIKKETSNSSKFKKERRLTFSAIVPFVVVTQ
ncbi:unnamed protein product [Caenorhabditis auriculariae]|uniref:Uncharacterized protein n=1 Tax=Caenorhabditis auriculariae TaxID=2777116 RepID=A0A8S1HZT9_9PELO|nr:unnamed protein product [Caenorhabditis auriculariae]